jgi:ribonuclease HI
MALIRAIQLCPYRDGTEQLILMTDSQYSINAVTKWLPAWKCKNWMTSTGQSVLNQDLIKILDMEICSTNPKPKLEYVKGHAGIEGNEIADRMAKFGASLPVEDSEHVHIRSSAPESHLRNDELFGLDGEDLLLSSAEVDNLVNESHV